MNTLSITSVQEFIEEIDRIHDAKKSDTLLMRGQSKTVAGGYKLVPKAGRFRAIHHDRTICLSDHKALEEAALTQFKRDYPLHRHEPICSPANDWEYLSVAQHYGSPTRLMDWTTRNLVALYFATRDESNQDTGAVYVLDSAFPLLNAPSHVPGNSVSISVGCALAGTSQGPFEITGNTLYFPPKISPRIVNQCGLFMAFSDPRTELSLSSVIEILIPNQYHITIRRQLLRMDFFDGFILADMEATAKENTYRIRENERMGNIF